MAKTSAGGVSLTGREAEWKRLAESLDEVRRGSFHAVFIHGEAGIGKTRLVQELIAHAEQTGIAVFSGRAEDLERMRPFGAIADGVGNFARKDKTRSQRLHDVFKDAARSSNAVEVIDEFVEFIEELAVSRPVSVVLEDLHWADPETVAAARALNRRLAYLPILFVGTFRPHPQLSDLARFLDAATGEGATIVDLGRLDDDAIHALVGEIVGGEVGPRLSKMLEAAAGNPLYAAELARALQDEEALHIDDGLVDTAVSELPPSLRLTILRRLSQFPPETVELLKHAAVLGSAFHLHEVAALSSRPVTLVASRFEEPIAAKLLEERGARLSFRHDLIHEAIYQDIPLPIRANIHRDALGVLRSQNAPLVRIAEHMLRALDLGDPQLFDDAVALAFKVENHMPQVALALADKALPLVDEARRDEIRRYIAWPLLVTGRNDEAEQLAREVLRRASDPAVEAEMGVVLGEALGRSGRSSDAIMHFERIADDARLPPANVRILKILLGGNLLAAGFGERAAAIAEEIIEDARRTDDPLTLPSTVLVLGTARVFQGRVDEAVRLAEEFIDLDRRLGYPAGAAYIVMEAALLIGDRLTDARRACEDGRRRDSERGDFASLAVHSSFESLVCFTAGLWDDALSQAQLAKDLVTDASGSPRALMLGQASWAQIVLRQGDLAGATIIVTEAQRFIADNGPQFGMDLIAWSKALILDSEGDSIEAFNAAWKGWEATREGRYAFGRAMFPDLVRLALACDKRDRAEEVVEAVEEGSRRAGGISSAGGAALQCRGLLDDDPDLLVAAVESYRKGPRIVETAIACENAARSLAAGGKTADARSFFEAALEILHGLGAAADSNRVLSAMRSAGIRRGARTPRRQALTGWDALTPTEIEVARLTVEGLTNPKIAQRLYVSKYTVQTHLSHIFAKLQVSSRAELAAIAAKQGLA
jgi:DNA-binding CsgD family transcriptional regulator